VSVGTGTLDSPQMKFQVVSRLGTGELPQCFYTCWTPHHRVLYHCRTIVFSEVTKGVLTGLHSVPEIMQTLLRTCSLNTKKIKEVAKILEGKIQAKIM
jgi:hypothetical protein